MTDEPTARDHAIEMRPDEEDVQRALSAADSGDAYAWPIVARMLADEVRGLRALAGAPTADVASLPTPEDVAAEMSRRMVGSDTVARRQSLLDPACRALDAVRALRPAAPEGAPAADVASELDHAVRIRPAIEGRPEEGPYPTSVGEVADEVADWIRDHEQYAAGLVEQVRTRLAAAPEGVDATDELRTEWGVRLPGLPDEVNDWEDDKLGSQRAAAMYGGEHVCRQVGPWVPAADAPEED